MTAHGVQPDIGHSDNMKSSELKPSRVAVCMATHNPRAAAVARQIDSIRRQTFPQWHCFISDDASDETSIGYLTDAIAGDKRFSVMRNQTRTGFYLNFERALSFDTGSFTHVALADQDDIWRPEKLELLVPLVEGRFRLAYSDLRIIGPAEEVLSPTFWIKRQNNYRDLGRLLVANCVTGSAAVFSVDLLPLVLPFPPPHPSSFHDHWIACAALATGELAFLPDALVDYAQHDENVIGHAQDRAAAGMMAIRRLQPQVLSQIVSDDLRRIAEMASAILDRAHGPLDAGKQRTLLGASRAGSDWEGVRWLASLTARGLRSTQQTMGLERRLLAAALWARLSRTR